MESLRRTIRRMLLETQSDEIICYHRSNSFDHMVRGDFKSEMSDEVALFGPAIYFAETGMISSQLGKYCCKFSVKLKSPVLDMNSEMSNEQARDLLKKFNAFTGKNIDIEFYDELYDGVQVGEFFGEISELYNWDLNHFYPGFIKSMGYNSFKYFGNYHTDFITERGDYGLCYGVYDPKDIRFVDGPF